MAWENVVNLEKLEFEAGPGQLNENYKYDWAPVVSKMGAQKLGFNVSILPPGQFSCPYHFHHAEEELFLILEGSAMLRQAGQYREVTKGDLILFRTGPEGAHQFYNHTDRPCKMFALSKLDPLDLGEFPDSKKLSVRKLKKVFQNSAEVEYLRDEEDPAKYWPKEYLRK
jgi:uncharacterized cupin superfamily protein